MNTFHMPFDEMTITLDEVGTIHRILLTGRSVSTDTLSVERVVNLVSSQLDVSPEDAHDELSGAQGTSVRLEWLKDIFGHVFYVDPEPKIRNAVRAFLLYILSCTLFIDKFDTRVPIIYLQLLMDLDVVYTYAWGTAALAYLLGFRV
eukprot:TRINITY_DN23867_c0_g2_i1.p1 TRINITY_DN23867_c0_g2~~TRINITY_DN23867_c0_g2_i1.p1  ORF type:complete len:147 (+),score=18.47 TRINITY_DN23867_c0_g2_i1:250-690(+)